MALHHSTMTWKFYPKSLFDLLITTYTLITYEMSDESKKSDFRKSSDLEKLLEIKD